MFGDGASFAFARGFPRCNVLVWFRLFIPLPFLSYGFDSSHRLFDLVAFLSFDEARLRFANVLRERCKPSNALGSTSSFPPPLLPPSPVAQAPPPFRGSRWYRGRTTYPRVPHSLVLCFFLISFFSPRLVMNCSLTCPCSSSCRNCQACRSTPPSRLCGSFSDFPFFLLVFLLSVELACACRCRSETPVVGV